MNVLVVSNSKYFRPANRWQAALEYTHKVGVIMGIEIVPNSVCRCLTTCLLLKTNLKPRMDPSIVVLTLTKQFG
jgi:hypothetical protein